MKISNINVQNDGFVYCKSSFYSAQDTLSINPQYTFFEGVNKLIGEIDSGNWAISYLLSMYEHRPEDFILFAPLEASVNNQLISLKELSKFSCYMDKLYPLFSTKNSVKKMVIKGLNYSKLDCSYSNIKELFYLSDDRFERPLSGVGNEIFRAMAAIGYSYKKEIFCFPWMSNKRFEYYHGNLTVTLEILESLKKVVIVPVGMSSSKA